MSKNKKETYDITMDVVNDALVRMDAFYAAHPMPEKGEGDSIAIFFNDLTEKIVLGWKEREALRHPYDYNRQMANHSDKSPSTLQRIYRKK